MEEVTMKSVTSSYIGLCFAEAYTICKWWANVMLHRSVKTGKQLQHVNWQ